MGGWWSRGSRGEGNEMETQGATSAFRYPPKSGNYFGSHFIMGGERFETPQPEQYLFGDNADLNFLGSKPIPFPYQAPHSNEPTKTLKALINIRKETLKFVKIHPPAAVPTATNPASPSSSSTSTSQQDGGGGVSGSSGTIGGGGALSTAPVTPATVPKKPPPITNYNIEFVFDCDCRIEITILYFCVEEVTANGVFYRPKYPKMASDPVKFKAGSNQVYTNSEHVFHAAEYPDQELQYDVDKEMYPIVIQCVALEGDEPRQSHATTASVDKYSDGCYYIKPLKQKLFVDGLVYLLQEIYGIENKNASRNKFTDEEDSDAENAAECVICMSDSRDTLILPCRHLCLCHACADSLRYQASNCPICRAPFRALLQIRAVYRIPPTHLEYPSLPPEMPVAVSQMNAIPGYEMVPLLEALNGPYLPSELLAAASLSYSHSLSRHEAASRALNCGETESDHCPIAMTVMTVSHHPSDSEADKEKRKLKIGIGDIPTGGGGSTAKTPIASDPEDELHFSEAIETLPDLQEFGGEGDPLDTPYVLTRRIRTNNKVDNNKPSHHVAYNNSHPLTSSTGPTVVKTMGVARQDGEREEEEMKLQSVEGSPVHGTSVLMIAAIDEFSDEEDTSRTNKDVSPHLRRTLSGDRRRISESTQSTPKKRVVLSAGSSTHPRRPHSQNPEDIIIDDDDDEGGQSFRYRASTGGGGPRSTKSGIATSLPTTPNARTPHSYSHSHHLHSTPGTATSTSTRSSGDSFTSSSSSTKQLLPPSSSTTSGGGSTTTTSTGVHHL